MTDTSPTSAARPDGPPQESRYARHALVTGWRQDLLGSATVVVIGVGALGNVVAQALALAGVGRLLLCDPDVVAPSNLSRCPLFRVDDVGRPKARVAAAALTGLAPEVRAEARTAPLVSGVGLGELRAAALVVSCLDSRAARIELASRCNLVGAAMLDGGTHDWGGQVTYFPPGGRCWACGTPPEELALVDSPWSCTAPLAAGLPVGASAPVSFLVGSWLAGHAVRLLLGLPVERLPLRIDAYGSALPVSVRGSMNTPGEDCPLHEHIDEDDVRRLPFGHEAPVSALLAHTGPDEEPLGWAGFRAADEPPNALPAAFRLRAAPPEATLREIGVAPAEVLAVTRRDGSGLRYLELAGDGGIA
ncbi:ThiF family adenylyltransferase [Streptomyces griseus]|uniref:HesA/MoeB/ThiF family protein n=1 Tax=Streptomyces griseus TaxID=1911 RepID=UPI00068D04AC|nr:ThiF family adenylyltransferase [Streptomyces griseus]